MEFTKKQKIGLVIIIIFVLFIASIFYFNRNTGNNTEVISKIIKKVKKLIKTVTVFKFTYAEM